MLLALANEMEVEVVSTPWVGAGRASAWPATFPLGRSDWKACVRWSAYQPGSLGDCDEQAP